LLDDAVYHGETEACALAHSFVVKKGSKMRTRFSGAIPAPVSLTARRAYRRVARIDDVRRSFIEENIEGFDS